MELGSWQPVALTRQYLTLLCRQFQKLFYVWSKNKQIHGKRKVFLSYPFIFYQLNLVNDHPEFNRDVTLLKGQQLLARQYEYWDRLMALVNKKTII